MIETSDGSVNDPNVTISITGGVATVGVAWDTIGLHDRVLIENVGGQFDIGRFVLEQPQFTPDEKLDFTAQIADFDGDTATADFPIGLTGLDLSTTTTDGVLIA